ncbi:hypothetical protein [Bradyrhizobium sp. G127]|uniref:hypothetical protein n=1 Tax=Bradyrhizobium sp. G127 TaxID=2904800 RepID=UPI001F27EEF5|nr:hypothetical protein [Bradyrhizobium sp. G127]MCF2523406.1 hypothetical protein [Bradyrhizobium sp. G127]
MEHNLSKPLDVLGATVTTCEDAAYRVRQHVIGDYEHVGSAVVRQLRDVRSPGEMVLAEGALKIWLQERADHIQVIDAEF